MCTVEKSMGHEYTKLGAHICVCALTEKIGSKTLRMLRGAGEGQQPIIAALLRVVTGTLTRPLVEVEVPF
jgi:hypothetical protein